MKRIQIGLRLMLLLVALCAALFAWIGAKRELHRLDVRREVNDLQLWRQHILNRPHIFTSEQGWRDNLAETEVAIAERRRILGEPDR